MSTFETFVELAARKGIPLPPDLDNFGYQDAPLFHSIWVGTFCLDLTESQCEQVVDFALTFITPDCAPAIANYAVSLLG